MFSRRNMLKSMSAGFGSIALTGLLADQARADYKRPLIPKEPHFEPKAKRVIFLCMRGAPGQTDAGDRGRPAR